ncbi:MAG: DUF6249 domain-containing protein [Ginsengibacter sp.]
MSAILYFILCLSFLLCIFFAWFFYNKSKHEERKLLIQQGVDINDSLPKDKWFKTFWLKIGMVVFGLSIGLIIISILVNLNLTGRSDAIYPAILGVCGSGALIISHYMENNKK